MPDRRRAFQAEYQVIAPDVLLGESVRLSSFINLYGCSVGDESTIGAFVEIQKGASVGARCKIGSHSFICEAVQIEDEVFIGHGVMFINDNYPAAVTGEGEPQGDDDWETLPIIVGRATSVGSGSTILGGVRIGSHTLIGAGSVVTRDIPDGVVAFGNPARVVRERTDG